MYRCYLNFYLQCDFCGARVWARGSSDYDPDTGPECEVEDIPDKWKPNSALEYLLIEWCSHIDYTIIDAKEDEPLWDDVL